METKREFSKEELEFVIQNYMFSNYSKSNLIYFYCEKCNHIHIENTERGSYIGKCLRCGIEDCLNNKKGKSFFNLSQDYFYWEQQCGRICNDCYKDWYKKIREFFEETPNPSIKFNIKEEEVKVYLKERTKEHTILEVKIF